MVIAVCRPVAKDYCGRTLSVEPFLSRFSLVQNIQVVIASARANYYDSSVRIFGNADFRKDTVVMH